jgi:murein DD-endopeptidase MepM/ murein hydrolase activator NlpD
MRPIHPTAIILIILLTSILLAPQSEAKVRLIVVPDKVMQGEPLEIMVQGAKKNDAVAVMFASSSVAMNAYDKKLVGFVPIDINKKVGTYAVHAVVAGRSYDATVEVVKREKLEAPLGIPQKLGGNTTASQKQLVNTLAIENQSLLNLGTESRALWMKSFIFPVDNPIVTDPYGYSRLTGAYTITHKGTDFRAPTGTRVYAVNDGVVRMARLGRNYGNTIVIDHGNSVQSFYMHLSEIKVKVGDVISRGEIIGLSGMTGYAEAAHLHFTLRINDTSIDPMKFLGFFQ